MDLIRITRSGPPRVISSARGFAHSREVTFRETCAASATSRDVDKFLTANNDSRRMNLYRIIRRCELFASLVPSSARLRGSLSSSYRARSHTRISASKLDAVVSPSEIWKSAYPIRILAGLGLVAFVSLKFKGDGNDGIFQLRSRFPKFNRATALRVVFIF
jgi:hypothetical protein